MTKYINAGKLIAEIERRNLSNRYITTEDYEQELYEIIDSLQQEQPEANLEKEIDSFFPESYFETAINFDDIVDIARHFAEWGAIHLNARKEE